ncbi:MAG: PaREP1 family protein [Pyrobaculum sp.]|uniref:PaREP1, authentic frameshift n=1 Tax=Pyrobaculum aerophilum (strain ATCC 51768 / DSM 7523 / JCM 9630 / CIP 104966 / NBRC 100827 / IM2) TaxID=178306 RepID=Q8ZXS8_PYRAE|nr:MULTISPECIES: PaREP1 family protein [Pyrobaculum]AAL63268.1 paREP1, authentic frameshift [Pyrobaculum aerophilum str. IM2]MCX8136691.1 PaREP1 family protein [Pyrobaculum aerophilum]
MEARYEAELALKFLEQGLYRNAAGRAFQAWRALLAAIAVDYGHVIAESFKGVKATREDKRVGPADFYNCLHAHRLYAGSSQGVIRRCKS